MMVFTWNCKETELYFTVWSSCTQNRSFKVNLERNKILSHPSSSLRGALVWIIFIKILKRGKRRELMAAAEQYLRDFLSMTGRDTCYFPYLAAEDTFLS
jgi:hypothetical protein